MLKKYINASLIKYIKAVLFGSLLALAFPPIPFGFIAYIGLIPFLRYMTKGSLSDAFKTGYWWGFGFQTALLFWISVSTVLGGILTFLFVPLYTGLVLMLLRKTYLKFGNYALLVFPFLWTAVEYLRSLWVLGFIWMSLGNSQTYFPTLIQYADITGVYGITFFICCLNVCLFMVIKESYYMIKNMDFGNVTKMLVIPSLILVFIFSAALFYGRYRLSEGLANYEKIKISMIQGHIGMAEKEDARYKDKNLQIYKDLSDKAAEYNPDLIIWPETATASFIRKDVKYNRIFRNIVLGLNTPILTGTLDYEHFQRNGEAELEVYNSAVFLENYQAEGEFYEKIKLVPFGEWFPYEDKIPFLKSFDFGQAGFVPGKEQNVFKMNKYYNKKTVGLFSDSLKIENTIPFSALICFESTLSTFVKEFVANGARMLIVVTNDNWFGRTPGHYQHAQIAAIRAIENRVGVAHCSNSGVSVAFDPYGRKIFAGNVWKREFINGEAYYRKEGVENTFYTDHGDLFSQACVGISILMCGIAFVFHKEEKVDEEYI